MSVLEGLKPERVFYYFERICSIPHGSGNTRQLSEFCCEFAREHSLGYYMQENGNVVIYKPATEDYETHETVIIQGHLDMVCEKDELCEKDMETQGLELYVEDDFVKARGTTLGGDDGIAIAYALAVLESEELSHPPLEVLLTVDEETGMNGANELEEHLLRGRRLINIDSDEEGVFTVSCAGGICAEIELSIDSCPSDNDGYIIEVSGLCGGHSGTEINKGRANANKILAELLAEILGKTPVCLAEIGGGLKHNAIPRSARAVVAVNCERETLEKVIAGYEQEFRRRFPGEKNVSFVLQSTKKPGFTMGPIKTRRIIALINTIPDGVIHAEGEDVKTSLNTGVLSMEKDAVRIVTAVRSSIDSEKKQLVKQLEEVCNSYGVNVTFSSDYPAWEYREASFLRDVMMSCYMSLFHERPRAISIHAGLECGILLGKIPNLDCISFGPQNYDIHTTRERLSISSVGRMWKLLCETLSRL